ncbi:S-adenosyl-L-methionine-dependent methyltransferase [Aspergillus stella-maris]|uniref:S-adenosyl-L-methionine-dependent methyltransferase n=1 Tax=Aspergillus stella-maris TaxID=1810926 RepID=UPI003CCD6690
MAFSPMIAVSARIAVDLKLFEYIVQHGPVASEALARLSGAGELLIVRVLRLLSSVHFVQETVGASNIWVSTPIRRAMATKEIAAGHRMISQLTVPAIQSAPAFFLSNGYACPIDPHNGLVQLAFHTEKTTFEHITETPSLLKDFTLFMGNTMGACRFWVDWYPVQSRILDGAEPDKALIVDVGGGKGHDLLAFREKFPGSARRGQLVLQGVDLGDEAEVEKLAFDFFTEQPIKGARVYFPHHILHDWSDEYCLRFLKNIVSAMTPGYSKLLVHEMIVLEQGAPQFQAHLDMAMLAFNGGMERTRQQWRRLLEKAGLQVIEFWDPVDEGRWNCRGSGWEFELIWEAYYTYTYVYNMMFNHRILYRLLPIDHDSENDNDKRSPTPTVARKGEIEKTTTIVKVYSTTVSASVTKGYR